MTKIEWDDSLSVGINLIDEQHKMLIDRISDLSKAVDAQQGIQEILKTIDFMLEYTNFHFSTEEKHMSRLKYPAMNDHLQQHDEFKNMVNTMIEDWKEDGATKTLSNSINTYLINWLYNHIKKTDVEFGQFLKKQGYINIE